MTQYCIDPRTRKYVMGCGFLSFAKIFSNKYKKTIIGYRNRYFKSFQRSRP